MALSRMADHCDGLVARTRQGWSGSLLGGRDRLIQLGNSLGAVTRQGGVSRTVAGAWARRPALVTAPVQADAQRFDVLARVAERCPDRRLTTNLDLKVRRSGGCRPDEVTLIHGVVVALDDQREARPALQHEGVAPGAGQPDLTLKAFHCKARLGC
jgi:hypothetical protein